MVSLAIGSNFAKKLTLFNPFTECFTFTESEKEGNDSYTGWILVSKAKINKFKPNTDNFSSEKITAQTKVHKQVIAEVSERSSDDNSST